MKSLFPVVCLVSLTVCHAVLLGPSPETSKPVRSGELNIIDLADRLSFYNFLSALEFTNLTSTVRKTDMITIFMPINAAFDAVPQCVKDFYVANPKALQDLLKFHIVQGLFPINKLQDEYVLPTWDNSLTSRFNIYNHTKLANISTYSGAVISGGNYSASNGYIHVIDELLYFNAIPTQTTLQLINSRPEFAKLAALVKAADGSKVSLTKILDDTSNPHTLFAPNNAALEKLPAPAWDRMTHNKELASKFVLFHITQFGSYYTNGVIDAEAIPTYGWSRNITVAKTADGIRLDARANVIAANNATTTGVVHTIDTYLPILSPAEFGLE